MKDIIKKQNTGITLIALVISIIVLLILAGVTIASLTGDNGLLARTVSAKENTERAELIEEIRLEILGKLAENNGVSLNEETIIDILTEYFKEDSIPEDLSDMKVTLTTLDEKIDDISIGEIIGDIAIEEEGTKLKITKDNAEIKLRTINDSEISTYYGAETSYKSESHPNIKWQLFLIDADNYYLIASDYVPNAELPCSGNDGFGETDLLKVDGSDYKARFCTGWGFDDGVLTAGTRYKAGSNSTAFTATEGSRYLTANYLRWITTYSSSSINNICAVAFMMDTDKWQSFADGKGASYAIGGPTIEMFSKSWNAVPEHTKMTDYTTLSETNSSSTGYKANGPEAGNRFFGRKTNMWFIKENEYASGYWLASPYAGADYVVFVGSSGIITSPGGMCFYTTGRFPTNSSGP